jgi:hypothetical protein
MTRLCSGLLLLLGLVGFLVTQTSCDNRRNFATQTSVDDLRKAAEKGDHEAQFNLGERYDYGEGVPQNDAEAAGWYRKAAEKGHAASQKKLARITSDLTESVRWYRKAAEQGDAEAQWEIGMRYFNGYVVPQDYVQAAQWFRKAAEQGEATSQYDLGLMYYKGQGVPQDYTQAVRWLRLAGVYKI